MDKQSLEIFSSIDSQLSIIIILFGVLIVIEIIRAVIVVASSKKQTAQEKQLEFYTDLFRKQRYDEVIEFTTSYLKDNPTNVQIMWLKAKTLYQTDRLDEAKDIYFQILTMEPDWTDEAQRYLDRINERISSADA